MDKEIEVLLSVMKTKNEEEYKKILQRNNIKSNVIAINQVEKETDIFNIKNGRQKILSYKEKGASRSRNRLIENAQGDICIFADDDTKYVENYEKIIKTEFQNKPYADVIIFHIENEYKKREKIKKIGNKKLNILDIMKVRTSEIALTKNAIEKIRKMNIKFDCNFGPEGTFKKGEETVFIYTLLKKEFEIYSVKKKIGSVYDTQSTWFTGYNKKYLYDQGAIFYKINPKWYKFFNLQYVIRKYFQYRKNVNIHNAYKQMCLGAQKCKEIYNINEKIQDI